MPLIHHSFDTNCSAESLWAVLADLGSVVETNTLVKSVKIVGHKRSGLGAMRRCDLLPKGSVTERVCIHEAGRVIGLEVVESDWPVSAMSWKTEIETRPDGSRLHQVLEYKMKFGPFGWLLNALVMRRAIEKNVGEALKGVIRLAEART